MTVTVNGRDRELPEPTTVAELLARLRVDREGVAVAVNARVVPRAEHDRALAPGDRVEVLRAIGGG